MMGKKSKRTTGSTATPVAGQAATVPKKSIISDTTCTGLAKTTWQGTYNLLEAEQPQKTVAEATVDIQRKSDAILKDLADSFLHRIAAREQVLPYTDVVHWAIEEIPISDRTFHTKDGRIFGSFKPDDLRRMYHLPEPELVYNRAFVEKFVKENESPSELLRDWRQNPAKHKHESSGKYSNASLASPYCYAGIMMCRLWGFHDSANIITDMIPLMEAAVNSIIMDWATILSDKLVIAIREFRDKTIVTERKIPPFYYSAYIMDTLCYNSEFPVLGWRWTTQDPTPIHLYHRQLWKSAYKDHLYQICNGFMVPIHYSIYDRPIPRISYEASFDLPAVASWFGEEHFTYIKVFGSKARPHVLPLYIPDKLLAREICYQIMSESVTQILKEEKKRGWPPFPLRIGVFTLLNYKHAEKEAAKFQALSLATIPNRFYDPKQTAYTALEQAKLTKIEHQEDMFDDLFVATDTIGQAKELARMKYNDETLAEFNKLREQRFQTLPLDLLSTIPASSSSEPGRQQVRPPPVTTREQDKQQEEKHKKLQAEKQRKEQLERQQKAQRDQEKRKHKEIEEQKKKEEEEKQKKELADRQKKELEEQQRKTQEERHKQTSTDPELIKEWNQFDSIISGKEGSKDTDTPKTSDAPDTTSSQVLGGTSDPPISQDVEVINKDPSDQIVLQVEEIPPLDIFYSPKHRAIVKRFKKKRRLDQPSILPEQTVTGNVVWKEELDPSDDLTKLSQFAGAYSTATIEKASEVSLLLKTKDHEIYALQAEVIEAKNKAAQVEEQLLAQQQQNNELTQQLQAEKQRIDQNAIQLSNTLSQLRTANELMIKSKDERIAQLSAQLEGIKGTQNVKDFRAEATQINSALLSQIRLLCRQLIKAETLCETSTAVCEQIEKTRGELDHAEETISEYLEWQDSEEGKAANLPQICETYKNILFTEWETQVMKAERAASRCKIIATNMIDLVNDTLYLANMISQCTPGSITTANMVEQTSYHDLEEQRKLITGVNTLTSEAYWSFLIKPHTQRTALKCLTDALGCLIPDIQDATYDAQLTSRLNTPPEVEPMLAICQQRSKGKKTAE